MSLDPYSLCPCDSGKKLKFCCADIVADMERALQLQQSNQLRAALKILEKLEEDHPGKPWVVTNHASVLIHLEREEDARELLSEFFKKEPKHALARVLDATAAYSLTGYEQAKKAIHIAVQLGAKAVPEMISALLAGVASELYSHSKFMAARAHVALSMRFCSDEQQQSIFMQLMEIDGNRSIPYPLRGVHSLPAFESDDEEEQKKYKKVTQLSVYGCWEEAGKLLRELIEKNPDSAELYHNLGFMMAWDGNEAEAVTALHKAAELHADNSIAVECETVAQTLELNTPEERIPVEQQAYKIDHPSQIITKLDQIERLARYEIPQDQAATDAHYPAAMYYLLDRVCSDETDWKQVEAGDLASVIAQVSVYDMIEGERDSAELYITGRVGERLDEAKQIVESEFGEAVTPRDMDDSQPIYESVPVTLQAMIHDWYFSDDTPAIVRHKFEKQHWDSFVQETLFELPLSILNGKTLKDVAGVAELKIQLEAAVNVLDAHADRRSRFLDVENLRSQLQLDPPTPLEITEETSISGLSYLELMRVDVPNLSDENLMHVLNRAIMMHHNRFLEKVLTVAFERESIHDEIDILRLLHSLVDLQRDAFNREATLEWIEKGRSMAAEQDNSFEAVLQWEMRELIFRLDDPDDPELEPLLNKMNNNYVKKLPRLREYLDGLLDAYNVTPPWDDTGKIVVADSVAEVGTGVWSPGSESSDEGESKKLWVPGQD